MLFLEKIGPSLKAWAAFIGLIAVAISGQFSPDTTIGLVLTLVIAVTGAIAVWAVPNVVPLDEAEHRDMDVPAEPDLENPLHDDEELVAATQAFHGHADEQEPDYESRSHWTAAQPGEHRRTDI